jgi:flagellar biosynthesis protein FlhF
LKSELNEIKEILKYKFASSLNEDYSKLYKIFIDSGLNEKVSLKLISELSAIDPNMKFADAIEKSRKIFVGDIKINPNIQKKDKQLVSFVGSTGSGKTSTLVKLAIVSKLVWNKKVMIISTDTKKIGGAEQLETYASISTIPFRKVSSTKELKKVISENEDFDLIFLDTLGFNPKNQKEFIEVMDFVKSAKSDRIMLVQNSSTNEKTLRDNIERFIPMGITDVVLSKVDETETMGEVLSIIKEYNLPLSFVSYGQSIPDDIAPVTSKMTGQMAIIDPKNKIAFNTLFSEDS